MRFFGWLFFYALLGVMGYFIYPHVKEPMFAWLGEEDIYTRKIPLADGSPVYVNFRKLTEEDFPPLITLNTSAEGRLPDGSATIEFQEGKQLKPVRWDGADRVTLQDPKQSFMTEVSLSATDFVKLTLDNMEARIRAKLEAEGVIFADESYVAKKEEPAPEPEPEEIVENEYGDPDLEVLLPDGILSDEQIVIAMKQFIYKGRVGEFGFEDVEEWEAGEDEEIDGEAAQTGYVQVTIESVFGSESTKKAKAIIKGGRVRKMVWPKSGLEVE